VSDRSGQSRTELRLGVPGGEQWAADARRRLLHDTSSGWVRVLVLTLVRRGADVTHRHVQIRGPRGLAKDDGHECGENNLNEIEFLCS